MKHNVYIFGEMHTSEERDRVEKEIIKLHAEGKIDYLLSEEVGPNKALTANACQILINEKNYSISDRSYKLGIKLSIPVIGIDNWNKETYSEDKRDTFGKLTDCARSFIIRESTMALAIMDYSSLGNCAVIVGDSHLRGLYNPVMGDSSPIIKHYLDNPKVKIYRSPISDLKENNIVLVSGMSFNAHAYEKIIKLADLLGEDERQYQDIEFLKRIGKESNKHDISSFVSPEKETFCYVLNNEIVSMMVVNKRSNNLIILGPGFTLEEHRSKGYMKSIFDTIFEAYPKDKYGIGIGVLTNNEKAIKLYERIGFKPQHMSMII